MYTLTEKQNKTCQKSHAIANKKIVCIKKSHMHAKPWDIILSSIYEVVPLFSIVGGLLFERIGYNVMMYRQLLKAEWDEYQGLEPRGTREVFSIFLFIHVAPSDERNMQYLC